MSAAEHLDPLVVGVALVCAADDDELLVAARLALELRAERRALREASLDVAAGWPRGYADRRVSHAELQRRRALPGPLAREAS